mmetsp:Transcript_37234/g.87295  ORF Transcript_37234/g.87295 Transcript_37234/m.87295 type:complete len:211 (-) Transcript_37234:858-1490(-)
MLLQRRPEALQGRARVGARVHRHVYSLLVRHQLNQAGQGPEEAAGLLGGQLVRALRECAHEGDVQPPGPHLVPRVVPHDAGGVHGGKGAAVLLAEEEEGPVFDRAHQLHQEGRLAELREATEGDPNVPSREGAQHGGVREAPRQHGEVVGVDGGDAELAAQFKHGGKLRTGNVDPSALGRQLAAMAHATLPHLDEVRAEVKAATGKADVP